MAEIRFENTTENFNKKAITEATPIDRFRMLSVSIGTYNENRRMSIPEILLKLYEYPQALTFTLERNGAETSIFIDFVSKENIEENEKIVKTELRKIIPTGRAYFVTIPRAWIKPFKPDSAQLHRCNERHSKYLIRMYER